MDNQKIQINVEPRAIKDFRNQTRFMIFEYIIAPVFFLCCIVLNSIMIVMSGLDNRFFAATLQIIVGIIPVIFLSKSVNKIVKMVNLLMAFKLAPFTFIVSFDEQCQKETNRDL